jgi:hypothetical protein
MIAKEYQVVVFTLTQLLGQLVPATARDPRQQSSFA